MLAGVRRLLEERLETAVGAPQLIDGPANRGLFRAPLCSLRVVDDGVRRQRERSELDLPVPLDHPEPALEAIEAAQIVVDVALDDVPRRRVIAGGDAPKRDRRHPLPDHVVPARRSLGPGAGPIEIGHAAVRVDVVHEPLDLQIDQAFGILPRHVLRRNVDVAPLHQRRRWRAGVEVDQDLLRLEGPELDFFQALAREAPFLGGGRDLLAGLAVGGEKVGRAVDLPLLAEAHFDAANAAMNIRDDLPPIVTPRDLAKRMWDHDLDRVDHPPAVVAIVAYAAERRLQRVAHGAVETPGVVPALAAASHGNVDPR